MWARQMRCGRVCGAATSRRSLRRTKTGPFSRDGTDLVIETFDSTDGSLPSGERRRRSNIPIHDRHHQFVDLVRLPPLASCCALLRPQFDDMQCGRCGWKCAVATAATAGVSSTRRLIA